MKRLINEFKKMNKTGFFEKMTPYKQKIIDNKLNKFFKETERRDLTRFNALISHNLSKAYIWYKKGGVTKNNKGIKNWRLEKVKKSIRNELRTRIMQSLGLIKTQNIGTMARLRQRFLDWTLEEKKSHIKTSDLLKKNDKHMKMIMKDQTRKMIGNFDHIVAEEYGAIAFVWKTRRDKKVVGNPSGMYPGKGNDKHRDHFNRQDKIYFYHNTWAIEKRYINTKSKEFRWADFEDGMPGQPINCRCYAYNLYSLEDLPQELLTERGKRSIKPHF